MSGQMSVLQYLWYSSIQYGTVVLLVGTNEYMYEYCPCDPRKRRTLAIHRSMLVDLVAAAAAALNSACEGAGVSVLEAAPLHACTAQTPFYCRPQDAYEDKTSTSGDRDLIALADTAEAALARHGSSACATLISAWAGAAQGVRDPCAAQARVLGSALRFAGSGFGYAPRILWRRCSVGGAHLLPQGNLCHVLCVEVTPAESLARLCLLATLLAFIVARFEHCTTAACITSADVARVQVGGERGWRAEGRRVLCDAVVGEARLPQMCTDPLHVQLELLHELMLRECDVNQLHHISSCVANQLDLTTRRLQ